MLPSTSLLALTPAFTTSINSSGTSMFIIRLVRVFFARLDDHLHQFMADGAFWEVSDETMAFKPGEKTQVTQPEPQ
jgi:hypothetical protein